ncbi:unnamed protein product [Anisakis simplex]|uniref:Uncharacterized protein n=1 Tax=Anisakis simplex TaxID=6269 RepID=A0A3P6NI12_ANISI|nr:unnamed protein product [Anisakis simplex]
MFMRTSRCPTKKLRRNVDFGRNDFHISGEMNFFLCESFNQNVQSVFLFQTFKQYRRMRSKCVW